jgi:hypothetical protein
MLVMTTSNHAFTGAAIALTVQQPFLGLLLALVSHFVLDALPHYGRESASLADWAKHRLTWAVEALNLIGLPLLIWLLWGQSWWVFGAAVMAVAPDVTWMYRYFWYERFGLNPATWALTRFHINIQWGERPWGSIVELTFFVGVSAVLFSLVY